MPKDFNLGLVFLSYLVAVTASHVTLLLAARVRDPHATNWKLWVLCGGLAMGIGIWSMHFVATLALKLPIRVLYDLSLTALSWVFAIVAATAALWIAFHLAKQRAVFTNFGAALVMGAAVVGMHFTAVAAAEFQPDSICLASGPGLDEAWMAYTIGGFTFIILTATMLLSAY